MSAFRFKLGDIVQYNIDARSVLNGWGLEKCIAGTGKVVEFSYTRQDMFLIVEWNGEQRTIHPIHLEVADNEE